MLIGIPSVLSPELLKLRVDKRTVLGKHAPAPRRALRGGAEENAPMKRIRKSLDPIGEP
jgi:hypothetical protein